MPSTASQSQAARWLAENGPIELERLFRAIVFHPSAPILLADDQGRYQEASTGATKLLGLKREEILGRHLVELAFDLADSPAAGHRDPVKQREADEAFASDGHRLERSAVIEHGDERSHAVDWKENPIELLAPLEDAFAERAGNPLCPREEGIDVDRRQLRYESVFDANGGMRPIPTDDCGRTRFGAHTTTFDLAWKPEGRRLE